MKGGREVLMRFAEALDAKGLIGKVSLVQTGCLGPCFEGPLVSVFPDNFWYRDVAVKDVEEIVEKHIIGGSPVERLKLEEKDWG
jgi:(2Fe-2S) ferredoxin